MALVEGIVVQADGACLLRHDAQIDLALECVAACLGLIGIRVRSDRSLACGDDPVADLAPGDGFRSKLCEHSVVGPVLVACDVEVFRVHRDIDADAQAFLRGCHSVVQLLPAHLRFDLDLQVVAELGSSGQVFFGESMFSRYTDASKVALSLLAHVARDLPFRLIDCQVYTDHLASLGAREISRERFREQLTQATHTETPPFGARPRNTLSAWGLVA